jgi:protein disulfide-isomerase
MANSFNAHRLLHLAKKYNKSNELEELLFKAYQQMVKTSMISLR